MKKGKQSSFYILNLVIQLFLETFVAMAIGFFLGSWLDGLLFEDKTILTYVLTFLGIFAGLRNLMSRMLKLNKEEGEKQDEE